MEDRLNVRGASAPRHDPYRFWTSGILVELGAFAVAVIGVTLILVAIYGG